MNFLINRSEPFIHTWRNRLAYHRLVGACGGCVKPRAPSLLSKNMKSVVNTHDRKAKQQLYTMRTD